jgi:tyrosyl-tRNA synthetase
MGGTDQLFNLNVGRDIMPAFGLDPQVVMTTPLLEGLDGVEKMSKSLGNYVGITEAPSEMFGKLMSISDDLMWRYYELLTDRGAEDVAALRARVSSGALHPKQAKIDLARAIVGDFHAPSDAVRAAEDFERRFTNRELPEDLPVIEYRLSEATPTLERVLAQHGFASSASEALRKIQQGGVRVNGQVFKEKHWHPSHPGDLTVQVGRRAFLLRVT